MEHRKLIQTRILTDSNKTELTSETAEVIIEDMQ